MDINSPEYKELVKNAPEPQIIEGIVKGINAVGETSKENFEIINKDIVALQDLIKVQDDKLDPLVKTQVTKLAEDVSIRHDEMEKKMAERMDLFETAMQRTNKGGDMTPEDQKKEAEALRDFRVSTMAVRTGEGVSKKSFDLNKESLSSEMFTNYKNSFEGFIRNPGDERTLTPEQAKDLSVGVDPDGGYTVTPVMSAKIIQRVFETDPIRQLASVESITTSAIEWLVDFDQAGGEWEGESDVPADTTTPKFNKKRIPVHILSTRPKATQTLLEDSGINIESWLAGHIARRFGRLEGAAFVSGNGVGRPRGFLTYPNYTTAGVDEWGHVEQINMGAAAALTADGFSSIKYSMVEDLMDRGTWMMNRTTVRDAMQLKDGEGRYIWQPGLQVGQPSSLLGLPTRMSTTMPAVAAGALSVCLADWAEFYMIVDRLGITIQRDPYTQKPFVEFYTRKRVGGDVTNFQAGKIGVVAA